MTPTLTPKLIRHPSPAAALLAALALSACAVAPVAPTAPINAPVQSAVPPASPYRPAPARPAPVVTPTAPVESAVPSASATTSAPSYSGAIDSRTGLRQSAVVAVSGDAGSGYTVLYRPANTEPASVDAAPGKLCGTDGVASSRKNSPGSGSAMPGVQIMIVKCNAA